MHRTVVIGSLLSVGLIDLVWINLELAPRLLARGGTEVPSTVHHDTVPSRSATSSQTVQEDPHAPLQDPGPARDEPPVKPLPGRWSERSVLFDRAGSSNLTTSAQSLLERLASELRTHPEYDVLVRGHADSRGDPELNLSLSRKRAQAVADYLERQGIATRRIGTQALGASRPVIGEGGEESMAKSRRVEIVLLKGR